MSDIAPEVSEPTEVAQPVADTPTAPVDPFDDDKVQQFDRKYVEGLRRENAGHRTKLNPYEEAYGAYSDEDRAVWMDLAKMMQTDPAKAAAEMVRIGTGLTEQLTPKQQAVVDKAEAESETEKPMTRAEVEKFIADRDASQAQDRAVQDITKQVAAKYPAGSPEHREVLFIAAHETGGDIDKAFAKVQAREEAIVERYLTGKRGQAGGPSPVSSQGAPSGEAKPIRNLKDSKEALKARLANL